MTNSHQHPDDHQSLEEELRALEHEYNSAFGSLPSDLHQASLSESEAFAILEQEFSQIEGVLENLSEEQIASNDRHYLLNQMIQNLEQTLQLVRTVQQIENTSVNTELEHREIINRLKELVMEISQLLDQL